jgi:two-component system chemotaxis response regulator CheB
VLAIGVSTGGPAALDVLLPALPASFPLPVLIVQHMPELFTRLLPSGLNGRCRLRVREAEEGDPVRCRNHLHRARKLAPGGARRARAGIAPPTLHLSQGPLENHCRPAVDVLFRSAAAVYGSGVLAVVLTGMGSDGMIGCRVIREQGGSVLAQDQATSTVWGMPGAVANAGLAHKVLPSTMIGPRKSSGLPAGRTAKPASFGNRWCSHANRSRSVDYGYLRQLVFGTLAKRARPSRDYLFDTRLTKLLRNQGMTPGRTGAPPAR